MTTFLEGVTNCMSLYGCELRLYSATFTLKSYAYLGGIAYVEFGDCRTKLTATCCRCSVNVCRKKTRSVGGHYILYVNACETARG